MRCAGVHDGYWPPSPPDRTGREFELELGVLELRRLFDANKESLKG